jgi:hypothetical protein
MTKKNKHKHSQQDLKVVAARHKNEVLDRFRYYFDLWSEPGTWDLLPAKQTEILYLCRFTPIRFEAEPGTHLPNKLIDEFKVALDYYINHITLEVIPGKPAILLKDFITNFYTISAYVGEMKDENFGRAAIVKERFHLLLENKETTFQKGSMELTKLLDFVASEFSEPGIMYYSIQLESISGVSEGRGNHFAARISAVPPVIEDFDLPDGKRPAYKLGLPFNPASYTGVLVPKSKVHWLRIKPPSIGAKKWNDELGVYIQSHAIRRMYERVDMIGKSSLRLDFFFSFVLAHPIIENGYLLFPFKVGLHIVGYFKGDVIGDKILLRTFLFLTNDGTPESKKLKEQAGLSKIDISYWKIDTLRNFVYSDIINNASLRKLFEDSGCGDLFCLKFDDPTAYSTRVQIADDISHYLGMDDAEHEIEVKDPDYSEIEN